MSVRIYNALFYSLKSNIDDYLIPLEDPCDSRADWRETNDKEWLILPDNDKEKPSRGTVIAVGEGKILENGTRAPMDVKKGDIVHFTKYAPDELEVGSGDAKKKYLIVRHSSILAIEK